MPDAHQPAAMPNPTSVYERLAAFHDIADDSSIPLPERCRALLALGQRVFGLPLGMIARVEHGVYEIVAAQPADDRLFPGARFAAEQTYCHVTLGSAEPVGFDKATGGPWEQHPCFREFHLEAYLGARIRVSGQTWGTLSFASLTPSPRRHTEDDYLFLKLMAQWLGHAFDARERELRITDLERNAAAVRDEAFSRDLVRAIGEGVLACEATRPHRVRYLNPAAEAVLGNGEKNIVGRPLEEVILPTGMDAAAGGLLARLAEAEPLELLVTTPWREDAFPVAFVSSRPVADGGLTVLTFRDIGSEWLTHENLRLAEQVFEYSPEAILVTDGTGTILRVNPAFTLITGYLPDEAIGQNPRILRSGRHDADFYTEMWHTLRDNGHWHGEIWDKRKNGEVYPKWLCINAVGLPSGDVRYVALFADISERKAHEQRIDYLARHDSLTGLYNRRQLDERGGHLLSRARRGDAGAALLLIDLDHFKHINDSLGHAVGDQLLIEAASRLNSAVRTSDLVARLGGDEFVVLLESIVAPCDIVPIVEKIVATLAMPYSIFGHTLHASCSVGVSLCPANGADMETLLKAADVAMYQVKSANRNGWRLFEERMDEVVRARHQLEIDLRRALAEKQFSLHYQPQFDLDGQRVIAWEALLRWRHPERGNVEPGEFLPLAEETGLIVPIGRWVMETACADAMAWSAARGTRERVAINISPRQFAHETFVNDLTDVLEHSGLPGDRLELELTESALLSNTTTMATTVERIKHLGVRITLDDFGTGYSTLACLSRLTVDRLKIDSSFMTQLDRPGNAAIVAAVVALGAALGVEVVAEGVETDEQLSFLLEQGCMRAQGFHYGKPMPREEVLNYPSPR
jgi:diguanylate cyclase (GGDEF)-like protein/PAS domain S-box-containing protein